MTEGDVAGPGEAAIVLSGTIRCWNDDESPRQLALDRVVFAFAGTWEPSLIVEDVYLALVEGLRVRYSAYDGGLGGESWRGRAIKVEGFRHAALINWSIHRSVGDGEAVTPQPDFVDHAAFG